MRDLLGGKGANLAEMANLGLPVRPASPSPPRCAATSTAATRPIRRNSRGEVETALAAVGRIAGGRFSVMRPNPLLVSVRSGARFDARHDGHRAQSRLNDAPSKRWRRMPATAFRL